MPSVKGYSQSCQSIRLEESAERVGTVKAWGGNAGTLPVGWVACDGSAVSRTTYAALFQAIGTAWGSGDGSTTFNLPDLRGRFVRGYDSTLTRDVDGASRTASNPGGNTGNLPGTVQGDQYRSHTHPTYNNASSGVFTGGNSNYITNVNPSGTNTQASGGNETRPINAAAVYIIKI